MLVDGDLIRRYHEQHEHTRAVWARFGAHPRYPVALGEWLRLQNSLHKAEAAGRGMPIPAPV